jgi:hypothetical protein
VGALVAVRAAVGCAVGVLVLAVVAVGGLPSCVSGAGCGAAASLEGAVAVSGAGATADAALVVGDDVPCAPAVAAPALNNWLHQHQLQLVTKSDLHAPSSKEGSMHARCGSSVLCSMRQAAASSTAVFLDDTCRFARAHHSGLCTVAHSITFGCR